ncbi:hypothetical protein I3W98_31005 [Streptomyces cavourensis]|nr:hypothetical protein [Streptomyces cavourensis]
MARQLLGTTEGEGVSYRCDDCGAPFVPGSDVELTHDCDDHRAAPPAPADRATMLSELTDDLNRRRDMATVRRLADDAAAGVQPPTTSEADDTRARFEALAADWEQRGEYGDASLLWGARELRAVLADDAAAGVQPPTAGQTGDPATDYSYRWSQAIDSVDGGRTALIPGDDCDGNPAVSVWVHRDDAGVLAAMLADFAGVQPPTTTEAHRPCVEYIAEVLEDDGVWMYLGADPDPAVATRRRASVTRRHPDAETRTVRKTTTYTVEPEPAAPAAPEEQR